MCLKITVTNKAQTFCHPSLPALTAAASPGHPSWGRMLGCVIVTYIQISREKPVMKRSVNSWRQRLHSAFWGAAECTYCQSTHTLQAHYCFSPYQIWASWLWYLILLLEAKVTCQRSPRNSLYSFISAFIVFLSVFSLHCYLPLLSIQFFLFDVQNFSLRESWFPPALNSSMLQQFYW